MLANFVARMLEYMNSALYILWSKFQNKLQPSDKRLVTLGQVRNINEGVLKLLERIFSIEAAFMLKQGRKYALIRIQNFKVFSTVSLQWEMRSKYNHVFEI